MIYENKAITKNNKNNERNSYRNNKYDNNDNDNDGNNYDLTRDGRNDQINYAIHLEWVFIDG